MYSGVLKETYISKWVIILLTLGLSTHVGAVTVRDGTNISRAIPSEQNLRAQSNVTNSRATTTRSQNITPRTTTVSSRVATTRDNSGVVSRAATATGAGKKARNFAEKSVTARATATNNVSRAAAAPKTNTRTQSQRVATRARTATTNNLQEQLTNMAQLQQTCLTQYTECMDNYCNVLDENMGRCACSKNITNYKKTSDALKESNTALQDVAQQIQYIGLNKVQIETLFAETEAEMAMSAGGDNTKLKNSLDKIKDMVIDIKTPSASSTQKSSTLDLSGLLDFSSDGTFGDIMSLFGGNDGDVASISNQRGATLYNTAAARCRKTVLDTCKVQGVDSALITNTYDMTIDKDCLAYESYLTEQNDEMLATIRNATNVLQRARLSVAANKNSYDLRGCIGALETCMTDEYMCGGDYEYCLDYEGKYIVAGEVVLGSEIGEFKTDETKKLLTDKMLDKSRDGKAFGPCAEPMNLCQDYTYVDGEFTETNRVIDEYLKRVIPQIKKRHDEVIAEFRSECISDVIECVNENNRYSTNDNISDSAVKSCTSVIKTCMSALDETVDQKSWVAKIMDKRLIACENSGGEWDEEKAECQCTESDLAQSTDKIICINKKQLCESSHGTWDGTTCSCDSLINAELSNNKCACKSGYTYLSSKNTCVDNKQINCESNHGTWDGTTCSCDTGYKQSEDKLTCVKEGGTIDIPPADTGGDTGENSDSCTGGSFWDEDSQQCLNCTAYETIAEYNDKTGTTQNQFRNLKTYCACNGGTYSVLPAITNGRCAGYYYDTDNNNRLGFHIWKPADGESCPVTIPERELCETGNQDIVSFIDKYCDEDYALFTRSWIGNVAYGLKAPIQYADTSTDDAIVFLNGSTYVHNMDMFLSYPTSKDIYGKTVDLDFWYSPTTGGYYPLYYCPYGMVGAELRHDKYYDTDGDGTNDKITQVWNFYAEAESTYYRCFGTKDIMDKLSQNTTDEERKQYCLLDLNSNEYDATDKSCTITKTDGTRTKYWFLWDGV